MTTTTTSTSTPSSGWPARSARRSSCRWASAPTCASGGSPTERIVELDWNESHRIGELTLVCTPARHFSGRLLTRNTTLWASWVIAGPRHRAFFGGDTGYTKSFAEIGADHGPFDLTLMPVGAYHPAWPDIHMNPEEAVRAHLDIAEAGPGCWCRSTGRRSGWPRIRGRSPSSGCSPPPTRPASGRGAQARASASIRGTDATLVEHTFDPWWQLDDRLACWL